MQLVLAAVGLFVLGAIVTAVVRLFFGAALEDLAARALGRFLPGEATNLRGRWSSSYTYPTQDGEQVAVQVMELTQSGRRVHARNVGGTSPHRHDIRMRMKGNFLTGEWKNTAQGASHFGCLQLRVIPSGTRMHGRWIGFDSDDNIQAGEWTWERQ